MLNVAVHTIFLCRTNRSSGHGTRKEAILRIVLKVTASKCIAVGISTRCIPAGNIPRLSFLRDCIAKFRSQVYIPSSRQQNFCRISNRLVCAGSHKGIEHITQSGRSVHFISLSLTDIINCCTSPAICAQQFVHIIKGQLIQQLIPLCIIIGKAFHVFQSKAILCTKGRRSVICIHIAIIHQQRIVEGFQLFSSCFLAGTGNDLPSVTVEVSHITSCIIKLICCYHFIRRALADILAVFHTIAKRTVLEHFILSNLAGHGQIIFHRMRIRTQRNLILASFQHIGTGRSVVLLCIIRSHLLYRHRNRNRFRFARLQFLRLCKAAQYFASLLQAAAAFSCTVIGRTVIQFHNIFASHIASIGNFDIPLQRILCGNGSRNRVFQFPVKACVAQAIAKGELHYIIVGKSRQIFSFTGSVIVAFTGFVITISHINAFLILYKVGRMTFEVFEAVIRVGILKGIKVVVRRGRFYCIRVDIRQTARGVDCTRQNVDNSNRAHITGITDPEGCINAFIIQEAQFHSIA